MRQTLCRLLHWISLLILLPSCASLQPQAQPTPLSPTSTGAVPLPLATLASPPTAAPPEPSPASPDAPVSSDRPFIPRPPAWEPQAGDEQLERAEVFVDEFNLLILESYPPQYSLSLKGSLPTPCHKLRIRLHPPNPDRRIVVEVYALLDPDPNLVCIQVLEPFSATLTLEVQESGHYTVWINDQQVAEFDHP